MIQTNILVGGRLRVLRQMNGVHSARQLLVDQVLHVMAQARHDVGETGR
jgi:hypothetical protein